MYCPLCGSEDTRRDCAPIRCYALLLVGLALLFVGRMLNPELFSLPQHLHKIYVFGVATFGLGVLDLMRNPNRWCADCGYRFHRCRGKWVGASGCSVAPVGESGEGKAAVRGSAIDRAVSVVESGAVGGERPGAQYIRGVSGDESRPELDPMTTLAPVIACLKFRDQKMRKDALSTLRKLTGLDFGDDYAEWKNWFDENKDEYYAKKREEKREAERNGNA